MIDYYLKKHCCLKCEHDKICATQKRGACKWCRCSGCVWLDKEIKRCIFSIKYPKGVTVKDFVGRIRMVNVKQQKMLSSPKQRFILGGGE